jgi:6,7-dimethyl-8-ribityllumazine synthase
LNVQSDVPVFVLTDNTMQQSLDRSGGIHGNKRTETPLLRLLTFIRQQASLAHEYKKRTFFRSITN